MNKLKKYLYNLAMKSSLRKWALSLTGWKWWAWQIVGGGIFLWVTVGMHSFARAQMVMQSHNILSEWVVLTDLLIGARLT